MCRKTEENFEIKKTLGITLAGITDVRLTSVQENRGGRPDAARLADDVFGVYFLGRNLVKSQIIPSNTSSTKTIAEKHRKYTKRVPK